MASAPMPAMLPAGNKQRGGIVANLFDLGGEVALGRAGCTDVAE
jgi:hypothetical protein